MTLRIGTAGWTVPSAVAEQFPADGTALERYAQRFRAVEVNSSFHRAHRPETWARWAASVDEDFRFAVKLPKVITHQKKLVDCGAELGRFGEEVAGLGGKLGVVLVQLPPKLEFDAQLAGPFFTALAGAVPAALACEPRNASWFTPQANAFLTERMVARVAADPALSEDAARPGGWDGLAYWRLHGSPVIYRSSYAGRLGAIARALERSVAVDRWCMFDNTASSAATGDALTLLDRLVPGSDGCGAGAGEAGMVL